MLFRSHFQFKHILFTLGAVPFARAPIYLAKDEHSGDTNATAIDAALTSQVAQSYLHTDLLRILGRQPGDWVFGLDLK